MRFVAGKTQKLSIKLKQEVNKIAFLFFRRERDTLRVIGYMDSWRPGCELTMGKASTDLLCVSDMSVKPCSMTPPSSSGLGAMQF